MFYTVGFCYVWVPHFLVGHYHITYGAMMRNRPIHWYKSRELVGVSKNRRASLNSSSEGVVNGRVKHKVRPDNVVLTEILLMAVERRAEAGW